MYDVLIVGAGPSGSQLAYQLASQGHRTLVLEEHDRIGEPVCCAGIIGRECLETFSLPPSLVLAQASSATLFPPSGKPLRLSKDTVQAYIVHRPSLDRSQAQRAQEAGAEYITNSPVENLIPEEGCVRVQPQGKGQNWRARVVVIASGAGSTLPQKLGLGKIEDLVIGAQAEVEVNGLKEVEIYFGQKIAPGFFAWLVPTSPGRGLAGLISRHRPGQYLQDFMGQLFRSGKITSPQAKITYGGIPLKPRPRTWGPRIMVVGDAAGQVKPTTGGGIYYSLIAAQTAATVLHQALSTDDFSLKLFAGYERGWRKQLGQELKVGRWARKFYEKLSDPQIDGLFHFIESAGITQAMLEREDFSFDWHAPTILQALTHQPWPHLFQALIDSAFPFMRRRRG
jgi:geranylgeranyl reductase family protein